MKRKITTDETDLSLGISTNTGMICVRTGKDQYGFPVCILTFEAHDGEIKERFFIGETATNGFRMMLNQVDDKFLLKRVTEYIAAQRNALAVRETIHKLLQ